VDQTGPSSTATTSRSPSWSAKVILSARLGFDLIESARTGQEWTKQKRSRFAAVSYLNEIDAVRRGVVGDHSKCSVSSTPLDRSASVVMFALFRAVRSGRGPHGELSIPNATQGNDFEGTQLDVDRTC
jgi:hypothetical protein